MSDEKEAGPLSDIPVDPDHDDDSSVDQSHPAFKTPGSRIQLEDVEPGMAFYMQDSDESKPQGQLEFHCGPLMLFGCDRYKTVVSLDEPTTIWPADFINCWKNIVIVTHSKITVGAKA